MKKLVEKYDSNLNRIKGIISHIIPLILNDLNLEYSPYIILTKMDDKNIFGYYEYSKYVENNNDIVVFTKYEDCNVRKNDYIHFIFINIDVIIYLIENKCEFSIKNELVSLLSHEMRHYRQNIHDMFKDEQNIDNIKDIEKYKNLQSEKDARNFSLYFRVKYSMDIINI